MGVEKETGSVRKKKGKQIDNRYRCQPQPARGGYFRDKEGSNKVGKHANVLKKERVIQICCPI